jgi:methyl-accepting chemotaxis protein
MGVLLALQISTDTSMTVIMSIIAVCFIVMAISMIVIATIVRRIVGTVNRLEEKVEPLILKVNVLSDQGKLIAAQGKEIAEQFNIVSGHLSTATMHLAASASLIEDEIREIKLLVDETAITARDKVALVSRTIDRTHAEVSATTEFIRDKVIEPARELAAILAGVRRGLEVLLAPAPKPVNQTYADEEMFIG